MHNTVYSEFRNIVSAKKIFGRVLEIGAVPEENTLINIDVLNHCERIGVNIAPASNLNGIDILQENSNDLSIFPSQHFDCVISNATIEHDKYFWKTCAEIRRVLRRGGSAIIGTPGYSIECNTRKLGLPAPADPAEIFAEWGDTTLVYRYHAAPKDYYRFSSDAFREVIFEGYHDVEVKAVMVPPRLIGYGLRGE